MNSIVRGVTNIKKEFQKNGTLYLIVLPVIIFYFVFHYMPMYGVLMAFQDFSPRLGISGSQWVGFTHFINFFKSSDCGRIIGNTLKISLSCLVFEFPAPIIMAILLNELRGNKFKRCVQTISYLPHFISLVVICGMIKTFVSSEGIISQFIALIGHTEPKNYLQDSNAFLPIYLLSNIWAGMGWESIIYISALTTVEAQLYEAARIDGAGKWKQLLNVTLPGIAPTIVTMFILKIGNIMGVGYEKIILLYNPLIYDKSDVISSYVYRLGFTGQQWSYTTAIGLFNSAVNLVFLIVANTLSKKLNETSLW